MSQQFPELKKMTQIFSIEGNIGAGKSTFLQVLSSYLPQVSIVTEPLEEWQRVESPDGQVVNLFDLFCKDHERYAFQFQMLALNSHIEVIKNIPKDRPVILERCFESNKNVFTLLQKDAGIISETEWIVYNKFIPRDIVIDGYIYLKTSPNVCLKRIRDRNRFEEKGLSLDYIQRLNEYHEKWLSDKVNVLEIENDEIRFSETDYSNELSRVKSFIESRSVSSRL